MGNQKKPYSFGEKLSIGDVASMFLPENRDGEGGEFIEINNGDHSGAAIVVWRMEDDDRSPRCEEFAIRIEASLNACASIPTYQLTDEDGKPNDLGDMVDALRNQRDALQSDVATLDQESRQMRARMERLERERDRLLAALNLVAAEVTDSVRPASADSHLPVDVVRAVHEAIAAVEQP